MKKILWFILCMHSLLDAKSGCYVFNLTGRTVMLNFYMKAFNGQLVGTALVGPLALAGKSPDNFLDTMTSTLLPPSIDMHTSSSSNITIDAFKLNSKNAKDKSIKSCKMPTPDMISLNHDFKITLDQNQLVITQLNTIAGIPIPGAKSSDTKQWPSKEDIAINRMSPQDKIVALQEQNIDLQKNIETLAREIKNRRDKNGNIKAGETTKVNNRKKMISRKKDKIKANNKTIARLQAQLTVLDQAPINTPVDNYDDTTDTTTDDASSVTPPVSGGGTAVYNPTTGDYSSLSCKNGICPLAMARPTSQPVAQGRYAYNPCINGVCPDNMQYA